MDALSLWETHDVTYQRLENRAKPVESHSAALILLVALCSLQACGVSGRHAGLVWPTKARETRFTRAGGTLCKIKPLVFIACSSPLFTPCMCDVMCGRFFSST